LVISVAAIAIIAACAASRYRRRRRKQRDNAIVTSLNWSTAYKDRSDEINIAPRGESSSDVYEDAVSRDVFPWSSRDSSVTHLSSSDATRTVADTHLIMTEQSFDDEDDDFPDDLRSAPKIDIGPPIDEDGHELHNVEIV
jgi:hypothetical protein